MSSYSSSSGVPSGALVTRKVDLGCDINSLGISDSSIALKIHEALRKISVYAPYVCVEMFDLENNSAQLPSRISLLISDGKAFSSSMRKNTLKSARSSAMSASCILSSSD